MAEMTETTRNVLGLATGIMFGALLRRGGLDDSRTIVGQFTGEDLRVAKTMGSAVAVGALGHSLLVQRGLATVDPKPLNPVALVGGSMLFGAGMAISGYCPGTAAAAAGSGRREGIWASGRNAGGGSGVCVHLSAFEECAGGGKQRKGGVVPRNIAGATHIAGHLSAPRDG